MSAYIGRLQREQPCWVAKLMWVMIERTHQSVYQTSPTSALLLNMVALTGDDQYSFQSYKLKHCLISWLVHGTDSAEFFSLIPFYHKLLVTVKCCELDGLSVPQLEANRLQPLQPHHFLLHQVIWLSGALFFCESVQGVSGHYCTLT